MPEQDDTEFELDLDRVFTRGTDNPVAPVDRPVAPVKSSVAKPLAPEPLPRGPSAAVEPDKSAHKFTRKDGESLKSISRILTRPSTRIAAEAAVARVLDEEVLGSEPKEAPKGKLRGQDNIPELRPNKAHSILADIHEDEDFFAPEPRYVGRLFKFAGIAALVGLLIFMFWRYWESSRPEKVNDETGQAQIVEKPIDERIHAAGAAFENYLSAQSIEEKLQCVLEPQRVRPAMEKFYSEGGADPRVDASSKRSLQPQKIGDLYWFGFEMRSSGSDVPVRVRLNETAAGTYLMDWEDFVAPGAMGWESFLKNRPQAATQMRVQIKVGDIYGGAYPEDKFVCYMMGHAAGGLKLYGYVEKTHRAAQTLAEAVTVQPDGATMTLYLMFEKDGGVEQVRIVDIVSEWKQF